MGATKRILIVDDDPGVHEMLSAALHAPDREIESAYDGLVALQRVHTVPFDLVMTDVSIPGLDGMALLERINQGRPGARVVMMTEDHTPESVIHAIRERAFAYFSKPFTLTAVSDMVERALKSDPWKDDIELLTAAPHWLGLRLRCKVETADRIMQFLREIDNGLPEREKEKIATAFREILMNAIEHGGGSDPNKKVAITYIRTERALLYYVRDPGEGFSFKGLAHAAISNPEESPYEHVEVREQLGLRPGGFGILMTRELVDELIYNDKGNEVLLIKYLKK
jgi:CheY-like chemotaxis protein